MTLQGGLPQSEKNKSHPRRHRGDEVWTARAKAKAAELGQTVTLIQPNQHNRITIASSLNLKCNTCGHDYTITSLRNFQKAKVGCPVCIQKNTNSKGLAWPPKAAHVEKAKKTIAARKAKRLEEKLKQVSEKGALPKPPRRSVVSPATRELALRMADGRCFISKKRSGSGFTCHLHHLTSRDMAPELVDDPRNLVYIGKRYHNDFHTRYGWGQNTIAQFEDYCTKVHGITDFPWRKPTWNTWFDTLPEVIESKQTENQQLFEKKVAGRGHTIIRYENDLNRWLGYRKTSVLIKCNNCPNGVTQLVDAERYRRSVWGIKCCIAKHKTYGAYESQKVQQAKKQQQN